MLRPDASASISEPMNGDAEYVGIVAFFRKPDKDPTWKLVVPRKQWKRTDPVKIEVQGNTLQLIGAKPESVRRDAPLQSLPNPPKPEPAIVTEYGTQAG